MHIRDIPTGGLTVLENSRWSDKLLIDPAQPRVEPDYFAEEQRWKFGFVFAE